MHKSLNCFFWFLVFWGFFCYDGDNGWEKGARENKDSSTGKQGRLVPLTKRHLKEWGRLHAYFGWWVIGQGCDHRLGFLMS
jgi:hypothetical protein